ncbi:MAG: hypothetical protein WA869_13835 [Alloacidobacterium sp.]|jgi:hypothetical protein
MKQAAIGVRVHSGWSVLVAVSIAAGMPEIVERKRVVLIDPSKAGTKQPYHFAEKLSIEKAEKHISDCAAVSERLALAAFEEILLDLRGRDYHVGGCALLLASGRALPALPGILASHALIHTAEGEFFRGVVRGAFEQLRVGVIGFRERGLDEETAAVFGDRTPGIVQRISSLGRTVGPPWTMDEKSATLAACLLLSSRSG